MGTRLLIFGGDMTMADRCVKKSEETLNRLKTLQPKLWDDMIKAAVRYQDALETVADASKEFGALFIKAASVSKPPDAMGYGAVGKLSMTMGEVLKTYGKGEREAAVRMDSGFIQPMKSRVSVYKSTTSELE